MRAPAAPDDVTVHLRADGVSVVLDVTDGELPAVSYLGPDLGPITHDEVAGLALAGDTATRPDSPAQPMRLPLLPAHRTGWPGRPGLSGSRSGRDWSPWFRVHDVAVDGTPVRGWCELGRGSVVVDAVDDVAALALRLEIELVAGGLLRARAHLTNNGVQAYQLDDLVLAVPVPEIAREVVDLAGRWGRERTPQRRELTVGTHLREGRRGQTGPDAATVLHVGIPGLDFGHGEVWAAHVGWSGNHTHYAERVANGQQVLGGGELLLPGEIVLDPGAAYTSPWVHWAYGTGLDGVAHRFHRYLRARERPVSLERPVTLNCWEAVYFDHDAARLVELAELAAHVGVERFVLDDGWFGARRDATAGLGDWVVASDVWPHGLHPLVTRVRELGMQFGLWFEPEMVNVDSDLARAHPEWILRTGERWPPEIRSQQVLNLAIEECYRHVRDQVLAVLDEYDVDYVKWDHNRDLVDAGHALDAGRPATHAQTRAFYRLLDELRAARPGLEIESCASGGSRVDLGVLARTDRVWASDVSDPLERQQINRWTAQLVPLEFLGSHVASPHSHTTGRTHRLAFCAATALFGHFGVEWDLASASSGERRELAAWIALYRRVRPLLFTGDLVRVDLADPAVQAFGVVTSDRRRALFEIVMLARSDVASAGRVPLPGLDATRRYRLAPALPQELRLRGAPPLWWRDEGIVLTGAMLAAGVRLPDLEPEQALVLQVDALE